MYYSVSCSHKRWNIRNLKDIQTNTYVVEAWKRANIFIPFSSTQPKPQFWIFCKFFVSQFSKSCSYILFQIDPKPYLDLLSRKTKKLVLMKTFCSKLQHCVGLCRCPISTWSWEYFQTHKFFPLKTELWLFWQK